MEMYVVLSHNDGSGGTLFTTNPFPTKDAAFRWMENDILQLLSETGHKISCEDYLDDNGAAMEICGVTYEWSIATIDIPTGRAVVPLNNTTNLVAEVDSDSDFRMIYVGIERDGSFTQDLVAVGEDYEFADDLEIIHKSGAYAVRVYSDSGSEDYTHKYYIKQYEYEEPNEYFF